MYEYLRKHLDVRILEARPGPSKIHSKKTHLTKLVRDSFFTLLRGRKVKENFFYLFTSRTGLHFSDDTTTETMHNEGGNIKTENGS